MKVKTSELIGPALDWTVAKALGIRTYIGRYEHTLTGPCILDADLVDMQTDGEQELKHSRSWAQGGPIIEREKLCIGFQHQLDNMYTRTIDPDVICWARTTAGGHLKHGPTPLIAAMRCIVASKLGDDVDVPEELL